MPTSSDDAERPRRPLGRGFAVPAATEAVAEPEVVRPTEAEAPPEVVLPEPVLLPEPAPIPAARPELAAPEAEVPEPEPVPEPQVPVAEVPVAEVSIAEPPAVPAVPAVPAAESAADTVAPPTADGEAVEGGGHFTVRLANFEGPFDLLLQLISKHKLDVTEIALSTVTNEFMAYIHAMGPDWDLDQTTEFLVVAATLLDLKAARLLPAAEVEDEADLALLEARDLLFARLLQYRAYKQIAAIFAERLDSEALRYPRTVGLEPQHAELLPEVVLSIGPERFAQLAVKAMLPKPKPQVYIDHIHAPLVSVREQAEHVIAILRELGTAGFDELTRDAPDTLTVVARFLALLELYREKAVTLDQEEALGTLQVRWTGAADDSAPLVTDEFDRESSEKPEKPEKPERPQEPEKPESKPEKKPGSPPESESGPGSAENPERAGEGAQ
jgi:segregation and condensation protein A